MSENNNNKTKSEENQNDEDIQLRQIMINEIKSKLSSKVDSKESNIFKSFKILLNNETDEKK
jgi:hypothetical protein